MNSNDFKNFAIKHHGISSMTYDSYTSMINNYIEIFDTAASI